MPHDIDPIPLRSEGHFPESRATYEPEYHTGFALEYMWQERVRYMPDTGEGEVDIIIRENLLSVQYGVLARLSAAGSIDPLPWRLFETRGDAYRWATRERDRVNG